MMRRTWPITILRAFLAVAQVGAALLVVWYAARAVFRPDAADALRQADALFAAGRYYQALGAYQAIVHNDQPSAPVAMRLGMIHAIRGEAGAARRSLATAIAAGSVGGDLDLIRLYQGQVAAADSGDAAQYWRAVTPGSPLSPIAQVLEAEGLLAGGAYAEARAAYAVALDHALPAEWRQVARVRYAALVAAESPERAREVLRRAAPAGRRLPPSQALFVAPLLPTALPAPEVLLAALDAGPEQRAQLLGQIYLDHGWYRLAEAQFASIPPDSAGAAGAAAYAAYARWRAGDLRAGLAQLEQLVEAHPDDPRARALLALAYLSRDDADAAQAQLEVIRALAPRAPDTHLAWGQWFAVRRDYVAAAESYRQAYADAAPDQRGTYALALARFYLHTSLDLCAQGAPAAEEAAALLPGNPQAWTVLAEARLRCGDARGASEAARRALGLAPSNAAASYYLGRALAALGDEAGARAALINAADLEPASPWRARAEEQLALLRG